MRIIYSILFILFISKIGYTQQIPIPYKYLYEPALYNPSYMGAYDYSIVSGGVRTQWSSFGDLAPSTQYIVFNSNALTTGSIGLLRRVGIGFSFLHDQFGTIERTNMNVNLSYFLVREEHTSLSAGFSIGYWGNGVDLGSAVFGEANDGGLRTADFLKDRADINFGIQLGQSLGAQKNIRLDIGGGLLQLMNKAFEFDSDSLQYAYNPNIHALASLGLTIKTKSNFEIKPVLLYRTPIGGVNQEQGGGNLDFGIRLGLPLGDSGTKLYFGGGMRTNNPDANPNGPAGVHALAELEFGDLNISGQFENSANLGNSIEVAASYKFGRSDCSLDQADVDKETQELIVPGESRVEEIEKLYAEIEAIVDGVRQDQYCMTANEIKNKLTEVTTKQSSIETAQERLVGLEKDFLAIKKKVKNSNCDEINKNISAKIFPKTSKDGTILKNELTDMLTAAKPENKPIWANDQRLSDEIKNSSEKVEDKKITKGEDCNTLLFEYSDTDDGEYLIENMRYYSDYFKSITKILEETQNGTAARKITTIEIRFELISDEDDLEEFTEMDYEDTFGAGTSMKYIYNEGREQEERDGLGEIDGELTYLQLDILKAISLRETLAKKLNIDPDIIKIQIIPGAFVKKEIEIDIKVTHQPK